MGRRNRKEHHRKTAIDQYVQSMLQRVPPDAFVESVNVVPLSSDLVEISITAKQPLRQITVESLCQPKKPKHEYSTVFSQPFSDRWQRPFVCFWLGFCNHELRPLFQVLLRGQQRPIEVCSDNVLEAGAAVHVAGTFDGKVARLYVHAQLVGEKTARGVLASPTPGARSAMFSRSATDPGGYYHGLAYYVRLWRCARSAAQLREMMEVMAPPPHPDPNAPNPASMDAVYNLAYLAREPHCIAWWTAAAVGAAGRPVVDERDLATATRILSARGIPESKQGAPERRIIDAGTTILECCDALESLVNDPAITEPEVLQFFEDRPEATFLIEPDQEAAWREQLIQGYGQIDFVFRKTNGRYVAVEVEPPKASIFKSNDEFTKRFDHALDQVEQWKLGTQKCPEVVQKSLRMTGMQPPDGALIIGRTNQINNPKREERWHHRCATVPDTIYTWDDVLTRGRSFGERLGNPALPNTDWAT